MNIKKGDFVEIDYTGKVKEENQVFDTTFQKVAEDAGLLHKHEEGHNHDHSDQYSSVIACIGERHLLPGLDEAMVDKKIGKITVDLPCEKAFGKKNPKLLSMIPMNVFTKQQIKPFVGLELNIDGRVGVVRSVTSGRVMLDFNHPLAGRDISYDITIKRIVTDSKEKFQALLKMVRLPNEGFELKDNKISLKIQGNLPKEYLNMFKEDVKRLLNLDLEYVELKNSIKTDKKTQKIKKSEEKKVTKTEEKSEN